MSNMVKTTLFLALLTGLFLAVGGLLGGRSGMMMAFVFALIMNFVSYWFSDKIVLKMYGAQPIGESEAPVVHRIVRNLATRAGIPMPKLYLIPSESPNAFATGRNPQHAAVAVTQGIMRIMDERELEGVLAHELSHVLNRDILISTVAATVAGAISMLANMAQWGLMFGGFPRRRGPGLEPDRAAPDGHPGAAGRHAHPDGRVPLARVPGRRLRSPADPQPEGPRVGADQAGPGDHDASRWTPTRRPLTSSS